MMEVGAGRATIAAIASTRLSLNEAVFRWCLRRADRSLDRRALEPALGYCLLAADSAAYHGFGQLASPGLERRLLGVAAQLPVPPPRLPPRPGPVRWLHVMDRTYAIGGHTALVRRWMSLDPDGGRHHVLFLSHHGEIDPRLVEAARATGGGVDALDPGAPLLERAMALRQRAWTHADRVVLHVHPWSVVPVVALGIAGGPPVMLLNHLSQKFWVGGSVADLVLNLRDSALEWSAAYRGIARNALLPIPIATRVSRETGSTARRKLGLPAGAPVLLTIGNGDKYQPLPGLDFFDAAAAILRAEHAAHLVAVGPREDPRWRALREMSRGRVSAVGPQADLDPYHAAADVYLESFPLGSPTALLEVGLLGTPCVRAPRDVPPPFSIDGAAIVGVEQPRDVADYVRTAVALVAHEGERRAQGRALGSAIREHHTESGWGKYLRNAVQALPDHHRVYSLDGAELLPPHLRDFSVALATVGQRDDTLTATLQAALETDLPARVDTTLARVLVGRCVARDPALLVRGRLLRALIEFVIGRRLTNGARRARRRARRLFSAKGSGR
jgi:glycosyltransferase involved in cell wall biosynthesis